MSGDCAIWTQAEPSSEALAHHAPKSVAEAFPELISGELRL
jgi:hypothetical protein